MLLIQLPMWTAFLMNTIIALPLLAFLFRLIRYKENNYGKNMILILNIGYCAHPTFNIIARIFMLAQKSDLVDIAIICMGAVEKFCIYWAVCFAIFTYLVLTSKHLFRFQLFMVISLLVSLSMAGFFIWLDSIPEFSTMDYETATDFEELTYILAYDVVGTLLPVAIISFCYFRVYQFLQPRTFGDLVLHSRSSQSKLFLFFLIPIICLCPDVFAEITYIYHLHKSTVLMLITDIMRRSWALANLWTFWSMVSNDEEKSERSSSIGTFEFESKSSSSLKLSPTDPFLDELK